MAGIGNAPRAHASAPDWKAVFGSIRADLTKRRILAIAAGVTFYSLLAIFPATAALVALYGLIADPATIAKHLDSVASFVPGGAIDVIRDEIGRIVAQSAGTKGLTVATGVLVSLWSANGGVKALFDALNVVYGVEEKRGFLKLNAISLAFVLGGLATVLLAIGGVVALPLALHQVGMDEGAKLIVSGARWPALLIVVGLLLALIYRFGPSRRGARWRWISWGSAFASAAWLIASLLFSWYAANFGSFNRTYGSLGAVVGFMIWIWISAIVVLMGGELDAVMEQPRVASRPEPGSS
ncbi:MAG TPA: YihY/virulence factor BrkB family protein [Casimicrobiaceae bacterium]|nr:YihY/virulence factor BrkB family protein [Casimicrobiaceae bacterium]